MIRHPLQSALARTRPDVCRVTDGIAASLRQFSVAQRLSAPPPPPPDNNDGSNNAAPSSRRRAVAAVDEIIAMGESALNELQSQNKIRSESQDQGPSQSSTQPPSPPSSPSPSPSPSSPFSSRGSNVIRVKTLPRAGGFQGFRKIDASTGPVSAPMRSTGGSSGDLGGAGAAAGDRPIIRGGFRGRGSRTVLRGGNAGGRGRGGRGGRGRGRRGGRGDRGEENGQGGDAGDGSAYVTPEERAYFAAQDQGTERAYNPAPPTLDSLAGYAPAVATAATPLARAGTVLRQARILGGGRPYEEGDARTPEEANALYRWGHGVFFPTPAAREWAQQKASRRLEFAAAPPAETQQAVLEAALLGRYDGPAYAEAGDTLATVRNYVRRDNSWYYSGGEQKMLEKIQSLLPKGYGSGGSGGGGGSSSSVGAKGVGAGAGKDEATVKA